jgi:hypothetical protein
MEKPELFQPGERHAGAFSADDSAFVHETLRAAQVERLYEPLFAEHRRATLNRSISAGGAHSGRDITLALDEEEAALATSALT